MRRTPVVRTTIPLGRALAVLAALLLLTIIALAQSGDALSSVGTGFDLSWWTVDGGGDTSKGEAYTLIGTVGQPDAGAMSGEGYALSGGFWYAGGREHKVYLPLTLRASP
jgi:hypothetical protein